MPSDDLSRSHSFNEAKEKEGKTFMSTFVECYLYVVCTMWGKGGLLFIFSAQRGTRGDHNSLNWLNAVLEHDAEGRWITRDYSADMISKVIFD